MSSFPNPQADLFSKFIWPIDQESQSWRQKHDLHWLKKLKQGFASSEKCFLQGIKPTARSRDIYDTQEGNQNVRLSVVLITCRINKANSLPSAPIARASIICLTLNDNLPALC